MNKVPLSCAITVCAGGLVVVTVFDGEQRGSLRCDGQNYALRQCLKIGLIDRSYRFKKHDTNGFETGERHYRFEALETFNPRSLPDNGFTFTAMF